MASLNGAQVTYLDDLVDDVDKLAETLSAAGTKRRLSIVASKTSTPPEWRTLPPCPRIDFS